jgi:NADH-quinone oxidoreductase subunit G
MQDGSEPSLNELCERASKGQIETLLIAENDLFRRAPRQQIETLFSNIKNLVVLDCIDTETLAQSALALPSSSFAEAEGTLVSSEARAQRFYPVYQPAEQRQSSWRWLTQLGQSIGSEGFEKFTEFDNVTASCSDDFAVLAGIVEASQHGDYRYRGMKIARQTHRNSGRTAMLADISVHEPQQSIDNDTPLSYSMEGVNGKQSSALTPFVWAPGWNSNQSVHKFQAEAGGALKGGTPGKRLFETSSASSAESERDKIPVVETPGPFEAQQGHWRLLPLYRIFGSDELSARSPAINELTASAFVEISVDDAETLGLLDGDGVLLSLPDTKVCFEVIINPSIANGCLGYSVGLPGAPWIAPGSSVTIKENHAWSNTNRDNKLAKILIEQGASNV